MKHLGLISLVILAATTWWLAFTQENDIAPTPSKPQHKIDYFLREFNILSMTIAGQPKQRLKASQMQHFIDDDSTEIIAPQLTMFSTQKPDIDIQSETGYISSDGNLILLNGKVNIKRQAFNKVEPITIDTHNLRVQVDNDYAETAEFVTIKSGINSIQGTGLRAHFREPINIKILNNVKGYHDIK